MLRERTRTDDHEMLDEAKVLTLDEVALVTLSP
jgi:hypothetical protein